MLTIQHTEHFRIESPTIVTIGTFDGVHLGHQKILQRLQELKVQTSMKTVVLTFDPHPRRVLFPEQKDLKLLTTVEEKLDLLEKYGVDVTVVYPFSTAFAQVDAEYYIHEILKRSLNVRYLVIGYDHKFGSGRKGDINTLRRYSTENDFDVEEIGAKDIDNIAVSSSKIRKALEDGNIALATEFLGHRYAMNAIVIRGKQLGRTLGYPTANLKPEGEDKLMPKTGVYFVEVNIEGKSHFGMMNIGTNPTTDNDNLIKAEVHIFEFDGDIYGKPISLKFIKRLRDEEKFANLNDLQEALHRDLANCKNLLAAMTQES